MYKPAETKISERNDIFMEYQLRIELAVFSIFFLALVVHFVNRKKMQLKYSLLWIVLATGSGIFALFPQIAMILSEKLHFETTSNFIFFCCDYSSAGTYIFFNIDCLKAVGAD